MKSAWKKALYWLAPYASVLIASLLVLIWTMRLWKADLHVPFSYSGDTLCLEMWIKGIVDNGWYLHNHALGLPSTLEMEDYPLADNLHLGLIKLISLACYDHAVVLNLYFLLGFPLSALSAFWVLRRFQVSYGPSLVGSLLFAFTPYHFFRGEDHLFLAAYFLIPLMVMLMLRICQGWTVAGTLRVPEPGRAECASYDGNQMESSRRPRGWMNWQWLLSLALCVLVGSAGVYYAFFSCFLLLVAGIWAGLQRRSWAPLLLSAVLVGVMSMAVLANLMPSTLYHLQHGPNPDGVVRYPTEAESLALKINNLIFPMMEHRLDQYVHPAYTEGYDYGTNLGIFGSCGFVILMVRFLFRRYSTPGPQLLDLLGILSMAALLLATTGGFGYLFSFLITPWIRCYYRMSIFLAFFSVFASALAVDQLGNKICQLRMGKFIFAGLCLMVVLGGIWDQTSRLKIFIPLYQETKEEFESDAEFVRRIEAQIPGQAVFQLPYIPFPEVCINKVYSYDHFRGYLHSRTLRWSSGAFKGRPADYWQREVSRQPAEKLVETVALAGFAGIYLDRKGFTDRAVSLEAQLSHLLQCPPLVSSNQRLAFFDLSHYSQRLRRRLGETEWGSRRAAVLQPLQLAISWAGGFSFLEGHPDNQWRWCSGDGQLIIRNSSQQPMAIVLEMSLSCGEGQRSNLWIECPYFSDHLEICEIPSFFKKRINLPPGRQVITFHCDGDRLNLPKDSRNLVFRINNLHMSCPSPDEALMASRE